MNIRKIALEWAKTDLFRDKIESALAIIRRYSKEKAYVAVSGGKDSLALLHLAYRVKKFDVFHWDHGPFLMPREIEKDILSCIFSIAKKENIIVLSSPKLSVESARWDYRVWYRSFFGNLKKFVKERGYRVAFLGLRGEESTKRRKRAKQIIEKDNSTNVKLVYPIWNWKWIDVWAYIFSNNIRFPKVYYKLALLYGWDKARLVTFFDKEFEHLGSLDVSKFILPFDL